MIGVLLTQPIPCVVRRSYFPGESIWIPIPSTSSAAFSVRPRLDGPLYAAKPLTAVPEYLPCREIDLHPVEPVDFIVSSKVSPDSRVALGVTRPELFDQGLPQLTADFHICVEVAMKMLGEAHHLTHFFLRAPLVVQNYLPIPCTLQLQEPEIDPSLLAVRIHRGTQLPNADMVGSSDPFCEVFWEDAAGDKAQRIKYV